MSVDRHCDKCNLEVPRGTVLTTLCVDGLAHHLVDNVSPAQINYPVPANFHRIFTYLYLICFLMNLI